MALRSPTQPPAAGDAAAPRPAVSSALPPGRSRRGAGVPRREWVTLGDLKALAESFQRTLLAENKSAKTVETYLEGLRLFSVFLNEQGMPLIVGNIRREHVESFIAALLEQWKPAAARVPVRAQDGPGA